MSDFPKTRPLCYEKTGFILPKLRLAADSAPDRRPTDPVTGVTLPEPTFASDDADGDSHKLLADLFVFKANHGGDAVQKLLARANKAMAPRGMGDNESGMGPRGVATAMGPRGGLAYDQDERQAMMDALPPIRSATANGCIPARPMDDERAEIYRLAARIGVA